MPPNPFQNPFAIPNMLGPGTFAARPAPNLNPFAPLAPPPRPVQAVAPVAVPTAPLPKLTEQEESSLLGSALGGLAYAGGAIDKPFAAMRGLVSGLTGGPWGGPWDNPLGSLANIIPFSDTLQITNSEDRVYGRDILRNTGMIGQTNTWGNFFGGLALDMLIAPPLPGGPAAAAFPKLLAMSRGVGAAGKAARAGRNLSRLTGLTDDAGVRLKALSTYMNAANRAEAVGAADTLAKLGGYRTASWGQMVQEIRLGDRGIAALRMPWIPIPGFGAKGLGWSQKTLLRGNLGLNRLAEAITGDAAQGAQWAANVAQMGLFGRFSPIRYTRPLFSQAVEFTGGGADLASGAWQKSREFGWVMDKVSKGMASDTMNAFTGELAEIGVNIQPLLKHASIAGDEIGATSYRDLTQQVSEIKSVVEGARKVMKDDLLEALWKSDDVTELSVKLNETYERVSPYVRVKGQPPPTSYAPELQKFRPMAARPEDYSTKWLRSPPTDVPEYIRGMQYAHDAAKSYLVHYDAPEALAELQAIIKQTHTPAIAAKTTTPAEFKEFVHSVFGFEPQGTLDDMLQESLDFSARNVKVRPGEPGRGGGRYWRPREAVGSTAEIPVGAPEVTPQTLADFVEHFATQSPDDAGRLTLNAKEIFERMDIDAGATPAIRASAADFAEQTAEALQHNIRDQRARQVMDYMGLEGQSLSVKHLGLAQEFSYDFAAIQNEQFQVLMNSRYGQFNKLGGRGAVMTSNFLAHSPLRPKDPIKAKAWDDAQKRLGVTVEQAKHRQSHDIPDRIHTYNKASTDPNVTKRFKNAEEAVAWGKLNDVPEEELAGIYRTEAAQRHGMVHDLFSGEPPRFTKQAEAEAFLTKQGVPKEEFYGEEGMVGMVDELLYPQDPLFAFPEEWLPNKGIQLYRGIGQVAGFAKKKHGPLFWSSDLEYASRYGHGADDSLLFNMLREDAKLLDIAALADDSFNVTRAQLEAAAPGLPEAMGLTDDSIHLEQLWDRANDLGSIDLVHTRLKEAGYDGAKWFEELTDDVTVASEGAEAFLLTPDAMEPLNVSTKELRRLHMAETKLRPALERATPGLKGRTLNVSDDLEIIKEMQREGILNPRIPAERKIMEEMGWFDPKTGKVQDGGLVYSVVDEEAFHWFDEVRGSTVGQSGEGFTLREVEKALGEAVPFDIESARDAMRIAADAGLAEKVAKPGPGKAKVWQLTERGRNAKQPGKWLVDDPDVESVASQLSKYMGDLPLHQDGIYNQSLLTDIGDYMSNVESANSNLFTIHHFFGGAIRMGRESTSDVGMITLKQAWRSPKMKGGQIPELTDQGLVTLVRNNADDALAAKFKQIEASGIDEWTKKKEIRRLAVKEADKIQVSEQTVQAMDTYAKMMDPRSVESTAIEKIYNQFTALFKGWQTQIWPAFHTRNIGSGTFMNLAAEKSWSNLDQVRAYSDFIKWAKSGGKMQLDFIDEPEFIELLGRGMMTDITGEVMSSGAIRPAEGYFRNIVAPFKDVVARGGQTSLNPLRMRGVSEGKYFFAAQAGENTYKAVEAFNRVPPYLAARRAGLTPSQAKAWVDKVQYDYGALTGFERRWMRKIIPFYGWLRNNMPYQVSNIMNFPGGKNATAIRMALSTQRSIPGYTPKWLQEQMAFPVSEEGEQTTYLRQFGLPFEDLQNLSTNPKRTMERFISNTHPTISALYSFISGKNPYTGQELGDVQRKFPYNLIQDPSTSMLVERLNPFARAITETRKVARVGQAIVDPEAAGIAPGWAAADVLTGLKLPTYDAEMARLRDLSNALRARAEESPYVRTFETPYIPRKLQAEAPPEAVYTLKQLQALQREMQALRAARL